MWATGRDHGHDQLVRDALRSLARHEPDDELVARAIAESEEATFESAVAQGMGPALASACERIGVPIPADLRGHVENARFARAASVGVLRNMTAEFDRSEIPFVVLKGIVLASVYPQPELRTFNDIDVLVEGRDLGRALDALHRIGATDINRNWGKYLEHGVAETPVWTPGIGIDLHWHVVGLERDRTGIDLDISAMIGRRRTVDVGGTDVWTLDPVDLLIHVALHAGRSGATKLVWLRDVAELVRADPPDWDLFVDRAASSGTGALIGQVLDRARCELDAEIPADVPARLCSGLLLRARRLVDARDHGGGLPTRFARGFPVVVSRRSAPDTASAVRRTLSERLSSDEHWNVGDSTGPLYWNHPSGGPNGRQKYLDFASRTG